MIDDLQTTLTDYQQKWQSFVASVDSPTVLADATMTAIGWKTADQDDFDAKFLTLRDMSDQVHVGWVNNRWLATFYLRESRLDPDVRLIKLMQRRPGSVDAIGLDHVDFLLPSGADAKAVLSQDPRIEWTEEKNGDHCKWISVWFAGSEAKLRSDTVLQVCIDELQAVQTAIRDDK